MKATASTLAASLVVCWLLAHTSMRGAAAEPVERSHAAVSALVETARSQASAGHTSQAAATLERALIVDSGDPLVWHRLAEIRLRQGRIRQAEQLALKSNSLPRSGARLRVENWRLVARARARRGDGDGARAAQSQAKRLTSQLR